MALDGAQFVRAVMLKLEAATAADLAEKMRWKRGTERLVAKWLAGTNRPSYPYVMEMIDKADLLDIEATTARPPTEAEAGMIGDHREEIAALLRRLQELTAE